MKRITLFLFFFLFKTILFAQNYSIIGSIDTTTFINALQIDHNKIYVGCSYITPSPNSFLKNGFVQQWNGSSWNEVCTAVDSLKANSDVESVAVEGNGNLFVTGNFTDSISAFKGHHFLTEWNNFSWTKIDNAFLQNYSYESLYPICYDRNGNVLSCFMYYPTLTSKPNYQIKKWDGTSWSTIGLNSSSIIDSTIFCITTDLNGNIYLGGSFYDKQTFDSTYVAKWNGTSWSKLGSGFKFSNSLNGINSIYAITTDNHNHVYAAGYLKDSVGNFFIAEWDGSKWNDIGNSSAFFFGLPYNNTTITSLLYDTLQNNLYAAGHLSDSIGKNFFIAKWDGSTWSKIYTDSISFNMLAQDDKGLIYAAFKGEVFFGNLAKSKHGFVAKINIANTAANFLENQFISIKIYPNPCSNELSIKNDELRIENIEVENVLGQVVLHPFISSSSNLQINVVNLSSGIYLLKATDEKGFIHTAKFVKE